MIKGIAADLHFHQWSAFAQMAPPDATKHTGNSRLDGLLGELRRLAEETHAAGGRVVVLAGDVFHVRGSVSPTVLNSVIDTLRDAAEDFDVRFIVLAGNHDLEHKDSTHLGSAVTALAADHVRVVNKPAVIDDMVLVPWFEKIDELKSVLLAQAEAFPEVERAKLDLILHAPIDGVIEGLPAHGLSPEYLASLGFRRVFSGHYHNHKLCYAGSPGDATYTADVYSIGALAHHSWSDVGSKAGFLIVDDKTVSWRKSHLPSFVDVEKLDTADPIELEAAVRDNFVRLKLEASKSSLVEGARAELQSMGAAGVLIMATPEPPARAEGVRATVHAGASIESSIGEYVKTLPGVADKVSEVLSAALSVLSAADEVALP